MAATHTVTLYAVIIALCGFALGSLVIWSRREFRMRLLGVGLSVAMAVVAAFVFSQLPGKPNDITAEEFREKYRCSMITPVRVEQNAPIYLLAKKKHAREPEYLIIAWNMRLATSLQKSMRAQKSNAKGSIIYGRTSCADDEDFGMGPGGKGKGKKGKGRSGAGKLGNKQGSPGGQQPGSSGEEHDDGDGFTFYPDPVPPLPEKNYGPLFEGPIMMPEKK